jgi:hypothetical protein
MLLHINGKSVKKKQKKTKKSEDGSKPNTVTLEPPGQS